MSDPKELLAIFGYGSLVNPRSIGQTLGRLPAREDLQVVRLRGYRRAWNVVDEVFDADGAPRPAVFLDLEECPGAAVVGVCFHVDPAQLERFDARERHYDRIDVSAAIDPPLPGRVFTYVGKPQHRVGGTQAWVMSRYEAIIEEGVRFWGDPFAREFEQTTAPHSFPRADGAYAFVKPQGA